MSRKAFIILTMVLFVSGSAPLCAAAQGQSVLVNALVRVVFNKSTGLFEASSSVDPVLRLYDAAPSMVIGRNWGPPAAYDLEKSGQVVSAGTATEVQVEKESFTDRLGSGEKLVVTYSFPGKVPSLQYDLRLYNGKPWIGVTAYIPKGDYPVRSFSVIKGKVQTLSAFNTRIYVNAGTAVGDSGVMQMGLRSVDSTVLSVLYEPTVQDSLGLGFYSFYRASTSVTSQYLGAHTIGVNAVAHYYGYRPKDGKLRTESLLLSFGRNPLKRLTDWADATVMEVHPKFIHDTRRGSLNTWYIYGNKTNANEILDQAKLLKNSILPDYGITSVLLGEWQYQQSSTGNLGDSLGFGETRTDRQLYPQGVKWLADKIVALGLHPAFGANYAYAAPHSSIAEKHVPWIDWSDFSRLDFGYPIDFTNPEAQKWVYDLAHRTVEFKAVEWWDDFNGGPTRGRLYDPNKIMQFEDIRDGLKSIRRAIGPNVAIHMFCCGPNFADVGLVDRVRVAVDARALGNWDGFKGMARRLAANYMLNQRIWINDPDPVFVGGRYNRDMGSGPIGPDPALRGEVRMRLQEQAISGGPVTIGENLTDLTPERLHLLTLVLPPYGQAARPLDMFQHMTPEIYDLKVKTAWDHWHVLMLQNWNNRDATYRIRFSRLGLSEHKSYLVFSFWNQKFLGEFRNDVLLDVKAKSGETYAIRPVPAHPWVLSTDMSLTQGGVELHHVRYDPSTGELQGTAQRNPGYEGHLVVYVPIGYKVSSATGKYTERDEASGAKIVHLEVSFKASDTPWSLSFQKDSL